MGEVDPLLLLLLLSLVLLLELLPLLPPASSFASFRPLPPTLDGVLSLLPSTPGRSSLTLPFLWPVRSSDFSLSLPSSPVSIFSTSSPGDLATLPLLLLWLQSSCLRRSSKETLHSFSVLGSNKRDKMSLFFCRALKRTFSLKPRKQKEWRRESMEDTLVMLHQP